MSQEDIARLQAQASRQDALIESLGKDLRDVVLAVKAVAENHERSLADLRATFDSSIASIRESIDRRNNQDRSRTISILAIIIPVVLTLGGVLVKMINDNAGEITVIQTARVSDALARGRVEGRLESIGSRVDRIESLLDNSR